MRSSSSSCPGRCADRFSAILAPYLPAVKRRGIQSLPGNHGFSYAKISFTQDLPGSPATKARETTWTHRLSGAAAEAAEHRCGLLTDRTYQIPDTLPTTLGGWFQSFVTQLGDNFADWWHVDPDYIDLPVTVNDREHPYERRVVLTGSGAWTPPDGTSDGPVAGKGGTNEVWIYSRRETTYDKDGNVTGSKPVYDRVSTATKGSPGVKGADGFIVLYWDKDAET